MVHDFSGDRYIVRQKLLSLLGASFQVFDEQMNLVLFARQKAFKLREDIRLFSNEEMTEEVLRIHARNIIDFSATYDVFDAKTDELLGSLRRKGVKSMFKDEWEILNSAEEVVAKIHEDSALLAFLRRMVTSLIPQSYHVYNNSSEAIAELKRNFNPFVNRIHVDFTYGTEEVMDKRIGIAACILLNAIDAKQS